MPMSSPFTFRLMREALRLTQAEVQILLGVKTIEWPPMEYSFFLALADMSKQVKNPTRKQMLTQLGAWLRFYKRLIEALPDGSELKPAVQAEFDKVSEPYKGLFEAKS